MTLSYMAFAPAPPKPFQRYLISGILLLDPVKVLPGHFDHRAEPLVDCPRPRQSKSGGRQALFRGGRADFSRTAFWVPGNHVRIT